tara:strand:- start:953 stop:2311 length:1359 start_codon:yes stop_codon:yes gene_type:complete
MGLGLEWAIDTGAIESDNPIYEGESSGIWELDRNFKFGLLQLKDADALSSFSNFVARYNNPDFKDIFYGKGIPSIEHTDLNFINKDTGLVNIDPKFLDLSGSADDEMIKALGFSFQDYEKKAILHNRKLKDKYLGVDRHPSIDKTFNPARFAGFLEDSPMMYFDVLNAAEETQTNPIFIYLANMQEGMVRQILEHTGVEGYTPGQEIDIFMDIGLEAATVEEKNMLDLGILKSPLKWGDLPGRDGRGMESEMAYNEKSMGYYDATLSHRDTWRATAGLLQLNKRYLQVQVGEEGAPGFKDLGIDFDALPEATQFFWMYSALNAGHAETKKLLNAYGPEPWKNEEFLERLSPTKFEKRKTEKYPFVDYFDKWGNKQFNVEGGSKFFTQDWVDLYQAEDAPNALSVDHPAHYSPFHFWMSNSLRVTMAFENMDILSPWEDTKIDVDKEVFNLLK